MAKEKRTSRLKSALTESKAKREVMALDGAQFVKAINTLYSNLEKEISIIDKERDEIAKNIRQTFKDRLAFVKVAWKDGELTKQEKRQIYNDYMDTSKAFQQYLMDKDEKVERRKSRKEGVKLIIIGSAVIAVTCKIVLYTAQGVITVCKNVKELV